METGLLHLHSALRWVIIIGMLITIIRAAIGYFQNKPYEKMDKMLALITMTAAQIQLVLGLLQYFMGRWYASDSAYWKVEHISTMIFGILLITLGYSFAKRTVNDRSKHLKILLYFVLAALVIISRMPWAERGWI